MPQMVVHKLVNFDMFGKRESSLMELGKSSKFAIAFFVSFALAKLIGLAFTKIFTNTLSEADMGQYTVIASAIALLIGFSSFGFTSSVNRYTIKYKISKELDTFKNFIFTGILIYIIAEVVVIVSILIVFFVTGQGPWFLQVENYLIIILLIALIVFAQIFSTICYTIATSLQNSRYYANIIIARVLLQIPFGIIFVIFFDLGLFGLVIGLAVSETIVAIYSIFHIFKDIGIGRFSLTEFKKIMIFSLPSYYVGIVWQGFNILVLLLVEYFFPLTGTETIALYRYGALLVTNLILVAGNMVTMVYRPVIYRLFEREEHDRIQLVSQKILKIFLIILAVLSIALYAFSPILIIYFTNSNYLPSIFIIPFLLGAVVFKYLQGILAFGHSLYFKLYWNAIFVTIAFGAAFVIAWFVIPLNPLLGLAAAFFVIRAVYSAGTILISRRYYKLKYDIKGLIHLVVIFLISAGVGVVCYYLAFDFLGIYNVTLSFSISLVLFVAGILLTKQIRRDDITFFTTLFKEYFKKYKKPKDKTEKVSDTIEEATDLD
ncbi:MAG: lipopolysaccharide biosynthesis protein [Candidatus Heimdallarchaeota archaeon]|nr:lipopolysaccharide biosynthesis protein [Candidatus Heimdallarchaeota archaeon]